MDGSSVKPHPLFKKKKSAFPTPRFINKVSILLLSPLTHTHRHTLRGASAHIRVQAHAHTHTCDFLKPKFIFRLERLSVPNQGPLLLNRHSKRDSLPDRKRPLYNLLDELSQSSDYFLTRK